MSASKNYTEPNIFLKKKNRTSANLAETIPGESTRAFSELAKKKKIVIIAPLFEKASNGKYYNSAVTIDADGKILGSYRKMHIPNDPLFYEKNYFEAGDSGLLCAQNPIRSRWGSYLL